MDQIKKGHTVDRSPSIHVVTSPLTPHALLPQAPIALVSLVDGDRQWFKSKKGIDPDISGTDRCVAFCTHAIMPNAPPCFIVKDTLLDPRFCNNPMVLGPPYVRFYAGAPIKFLHGKKVRSAAWRRMAQQVVRRLLHHVPT